ncbi:S-phase kinase-associated protein 1A [Aphelenchoides avenae]|nr:S-phase kinase-associated protein 1A [Aphelenchus avenae]
MSASNANNAAVRRQVTCETSDNGQIAVYLDILRLSDTFKKMYEDLGLEEHDDFPGVFPVKTVTSRMFEKASKRSFFLDAPEAVIEKDPLTQECKWFTFTESERRFSDVPMSELLEVVMVANFLDIPRLYHYACQSVAAWIKGKHPRNICQLLRQNCDLDDAQTRKTLGNTPWLKWAGVAFQQSPIENAIFMPNEVLLTIFEKLAREDLERLQFVSTQFDDVIVNSNELSEQQGPLRVVTKLEFGAYSSGSRSPQRTRVLLRDGTRFTCTDCKDLAKRLKFAIVQELRWDASTRWLDSDMQSDAYIQNLSSLLPVKSAWKNAAVEAFVECFASGAAFEFAFGELLLCNEIVLVRGYYSFPWSRRYIRLTGIAACSRLDIGRPNLYGDLIHPTDVVEWLEQEDPPEKKWSEPRQMILYEEGINGGIEGLLTSLKAAFLASSSPKPYVVRVLRGWRRDNVDQVLENEKTHEVLSIRAEQSGDVSVHRA